MAGRMTGRAFLLLLLFSFRIAAEEADPLAVRVAVFEQAPFVTRDGGGGFGGMAIDLWEASSRGAGLKSEYVAYGTFGAMLEAVVSGEADFAVGDISVTHERAKRMSFSFPWYDAGFRIMVKKPDTSLWRELYRSKRFRIYFLFFAVLAVLALLMTLFRRRRDPDFPRDMKTGYTLSLLDVTSSVRSGELEQEYLGWFGYVVSSMWMLCGLGMVAYVTSTMTTAMTSIHLDRNGIYELGDLPGKRIGALQGGLAAKYLRSLKLEVRSCPNLADAVEKLRAGRVQAVVTDAPALEYWAHVNPDHGVQVVGALFHPDKYAFAGRREHARLMDRVTTELVRLREAGEIERMRVKYFGGEGDGSLWDAFR